MFEWCLYFLFILVVVIRGGRVGCFWWLWGRGVVLNLWGNNGDVNRLSDVISWRRVIYVCDYICDWFMWWW